ncbi:hypothetical protein QA612_19835 [Evansella sp. AB-P1]|uniref:hypothetical protein n=1 Tax=Evansella sp. AB-P1 TaxID=3037653 RepID=UPI00241C4A9A|nr:hypothetical protein [Evansella sp. AB-P1]MDG5789712.1 hypothetical protein [Evansella sp. AB-P1]
MTNNKKRTNTKYRSQKGDLHNDAIASDNVMSQEEMEKAISPTGVRKGSKA